MRLALISDAFPPMRTSGAVQMRDLARELARQGHRPCVITPDPSLVQPWRLRIELGVEVLRLRTPATKDRHYVRRALSEFLMPFFMIWKIWRSSAVAKEFDGIIWYSPSIFFGPLIWWLKRKSGAPSYLILRDIFPDWAVDSGILSKGIVYRLLKLIERFQYSVANVIGVQSRPNMAYLHTWRERPRRRLEVLHNWLAECAYKGGHVHPFISGLDKKTVFVYTGNMGVAQGMDCLLELAEKLESDSNAYFLFVGRGSEVKRLKGVVSKLGLTNVRFEDEIDSDEVGRLLNCCDIGLVALDARHKTHNIPGKFLAYLQAGLPVLARINDGNDLKELIVSKDVGRVSVGSEPREYLVMHAMDLLSNPSLRYRMAANAKKLSKAMFSPTTAALQIVAALRGASS